MNIENIHKLSTREDHFNIHKTLGILALSNYCYRFYNLFVYNDMKFDTNFDAATILIHFFLSSTSLIFKLSKKRHSTLPIIYPEMRLHSIVFATRSVVCFFLCYFEFDIIFRMISCLLTNVSADIVTYYLKQGTTIRGGNAAFEIEPKKERRLKHLYSLFQLGATLAMLGNINIVFSPLLGIQIAALNMTLIKKGIITPRTYHIVYSACLVINLFVLELDTNYIIKMLSGSILSANMRFKYNINKYIMWCFVFGLHYMTIDYKLPNYDYINYILITTGLYISIKRLYGIFS